MNSSYIRQSCTKVFGLNSVITTATRRITSDSLNCSALPYSREANISYTSLPNSTVSEFPAVEPSTHSEDSFIRHFPQLARDIHSGLDRLAFTSPTPCQLDAMPDLLDGGNLVLMGQTGTGKTLAYLLPILHRLIFENSDHIFPLSKKPRALVVLPSREMVSQVLSLARRLSPSVRSAGLAASLSFVKETRALAEGVDLVVCTPARLVLHLSKGNAQLREVRAIVIDEADTLFDSFYEKECAGILKGLRGRAEFPQVVVVGATRTPAVSNFILKHLATENFSHINHDAHMTVPTLEQVFVPLRGRKRSVCLSEILQDQHPLQNLDGTRNVKGLSDGTPSAAEKTIVFTNTVKTCRWVSGMLTETGFRVSGLHGEMNFAQRSESYRSFLRGKSNILVSTNLASRGLDFDKSVDHVVLYDFPTTLADYLHRVGRTARGGRVGRVTAILTKRHLPLVGRIQEAARAGTPIKVQDASRSVRRSLQLEEYSLALEKYRVMRNKKVGGVKLGTGKLRRKLGLPPHAGIGSLAKKKLAKEWRARVKIFRDTKFLQQRGRIPRKAKMPKLANSAITRSDSQTFSTASRISKSLGRVQLTTSTRSETRAVPPTQHARDRVTKASLLDLRSLLKRKNKNLPIM